METIIAFISQRTPQVRTHRESPYAALRERIAYPVQCSTKPAQLQFRSPRHSTDTEVLPTHRHCPKLTQHSNYSTRERIAYAFNVLQSQRSYNFEAHDTQRIRKYYPHTDTARTKLTQHSNYWTHRSPQTIFNILYERTRTI